MWSLTHQGNTKVVELKVTTIDNGLRKKSLAPICDLPKCLVRAWWQCHFLHCRHPSVNEAFPSFLLPDTNWFSNFYKLFPVFTNHLSCIPTHFWLMHVCCDCIVGTILIEWTVLDLHKQGSRYLCRFFKAACSRGVTETSGRAARWYGHHNIPRIFPLNVCVGSAHRQSITVTVVTVRPPPVGGDRDVSKERNTVFEVKKNRIK